MSSHRKCPTPHKPMYDKLLAESLVIQSNYNHGYNNEAYECVDHYHIRNRTKSNRIRHEREAIARKSRKTYVQLTIFDWMKQLNGPQGI